MSTEPEITQGTGDTPDPVSDPATANTDAPERWSKQPKSRGRQPRDPLGQSVRFMCREIDDMENFLREYLQEPTIPAEHATIEFAFPGSSAFMVYAADLKGPKTDATLEEKRQTLINKLNRTAISVLNALAPSDDLKDQMRKQKAIAKVCTEACERADGFRYSFHNNWLSREDEGYRFSYFCNDSTLNKGRAANEAAGTAGKRMRKPAYDCKGLITIKFSSVSQSLEVHYKHVPIHKTYAERAPPPRRDSRRKKLLEMLEFESLPVGRKKRTAAALEKSLLEYPRKRPTIQSTSDRTGSSSRQGLQTNDPHPEVELVGSTTVGRTNENNQSHGHTSTESRTRMLPGTHSHAVSLLSSIAKPSTIKPKRMPIPGTMSFSMRDRNMNSSRTSGGRERLSDNDDTSAQNLLSGISEAAAGANVPTHDSTKDFALSELLSLKKKLEEAEQRIRRLESDKAAASPSEPQSSMPQHVLWPPPPGYPPPPQIYPPYQQPGPPYYQHPPQPQPPEQQLQRQQYRQPLAPAPPVPLAASGSPQTPVSASTAADAVAVAAADTSAEALGPAAPRSMSSGQNRFRLPPQRPFASVSNNQGNSPTNSSSNSTTNTPPHATPPRSSSTTSKSSEKRQMGRKFVPYKPGAKSKLAPSHLQPAPMVDGANNSDQASGAVSAPQSDAEH